MPSNRTRALALRVVAVLAMGVGAVQYLSASPSSAATIDGAATTVTGNSGSMTPLSSGMSDTDFGLELSPSAKAADGTVNNRADCSADTAKGNTNGFTYLIHANEDVTTEDFAMGEPGVLPDKSTTLALFDNQGNIQVDANHGGNTAPGTGQVLIPPTLAFEWGQITSSNGGGQPVSGPTGLLYDSGGTTGTWKGGFVCFLAGNPGHVTDYWQFTVTFTKSAVGTGNSQGFSWVVVPDSGGGGGPTTTSTTSTTVSTTTTTTVSGGDTTTTTLPMTGDTTTTTSTTVAGATGTATTPSAGDPAGGGGGSPGSGTSSSGTPSSGTGTSGALASTGVPIRRSANIAIALMIAGVLCLLVSTADPKGRRRPQHRRSSG